MEPKSFERRFCAGHPCTRGESRGSHRTMNPREPHPPPTSFRSYILSNLLRSRFVIPLESGTSTASSSPEALGMYEQHCLRPNHPYNGPEVDERASLLLDRSKTNVSKAALEPSRLRPISGALRSLMLHFLSFIRSDFDSSHPRNLILLRDVDQTSQG